MVLTILDAFRVAACRQGVRRAFGHLQHRGLLTGWEVNEDGDRWTPYQRTVEAEDEIERPLGYAAYDLEAHRKRWIARLAETNSNGAEMLDRLDRLRIGLLGDPHSVMKL
jgi:hypothetical protein